MKIKDPVDLNVMKKNLIWGFTDFDGSDSSVIARAELLDAIPAMIKELEKRRKADKFKPMECIKVGEHISIPVSSGSVIHPKGVELTGRLELFGFVSTDQCSLILGRMDLEMEELETIKGEIEELENKRVLVILIDQETGEE